MTKHKLQITKIEQQKQIPNMKQLLINNDKN